MTAQNKNACIDRLQSPVKTELPSSSNSRQTLSQPQKAITPLAVEDPFGGYDTYVDCCHLKGISPMQREKYLIWLETINHWCDD